MARVDSLSFATLYNIHCIQGTTPADLLIATHNRNARDKTENMKDADVCSYGGNHHCIFRNGCMYVANYGKRWSKETPFTSNKDKYLPQMISLTTGRPVREAASRRRKAVVAKVKKKCFNKRLLYFSLAAATWKTSSRSRTATASAPCADERPHLLSTRIFSCLLLD